MSRYDFWPSPQQERLLCAALDDGDAALRAWRDWQAHETPASTDRGSARLLPLVYRNLARADASEAAIAPLRKYYEQTRYANIVRLSRLARLLAQFEDERVPTLVLKGAALALQVYRDPGLRPMSDIDVAVPHDQAEAAIGILERNGWSTDILLPGDRVLPERVGAIPLRDADGAQFDLHFSIFGHFTVPSFDDPRRTWAMVSPFWSEAVPLRVGNVQTLTLSATDHLLHALAHGARRGRPAPIRWVADAVWIMRGTQPILWDQFAARASSLELSFVAAKMLGYLRDRHGVDVAPDLLDAPGRRTSMLEKLEYARRCDILPRLAGAGIAWGRYARQHPQRGPITLLMGFPAYLTAQWSARNVWDAARLFFRKEAFSSSIRRRPAEEKRPEHRA